MTMEESKNNKYIIHSTKMSEDDTMVGGTRYPSITQLIGLLQNGDIQFL